MLFRSLRREQDGYALVVEAKASRAPSIFENLVDGIPGDTLARIPLANARKEAGVRLRADCDFRDNRDEVRFSYQDGSQWIPLGPAHRMQYKLDHFMGARFGLFVQSTEMPGGSAQFSDFTYIGPQSP